MENQRHEIIQFCQHRHLQIDGWIEETISGTRSYDKRALGKLLKRVGPGDMIVCSELSRLGRNLLMIMEILSICMKKGCRVWTIKDGYRLDDDIQSKVLAFAFGLSAEIERDLISQRTRDALKRLKDEGVSLGRPPGARNRRYKLDSKKTSILRMLDAGVSKRLIAKRCGVSPSTLYRWLNQRKNENVL